MDRGDAEDGERTREGMYRQVMSVSPFKDGVVMRERIRGGCIVFIAVVAVALFGGRADAVPSLTPHPHNTTVTTWNPPGSMTGPLHQHRDTDPLVGPNGKYIAYSAWDDRQYRNGGDFGHGYMARAARYLFEADFPNSGRTDFDNAVNEWETDVNGTEVNSNGWAINISMDFDRVNSGAHEIDVIWDDIVTAVAFWSPSATDFTFDSAPATKPLSAPAGYLIRIHGSGDPWAASVPVPLGWHYGGAGSVGSTTTWFDEKKISDGTITENAFSSTNNNLDFYTIALHELGHGWGLDHFAGGIMREDISGFVMRDPDAGSIDGLKDNYAMPIPEPVSMVFFGTGVVGVFGYVARRRTRSRN